MSAKGLRGLLIGSLALIALGVVLLLNSFLLIEQINIAALLPLLLVVLGAVIVLRGDVFSGAGHQPFGITRGSVESGTLEVSAGAVDVRVRALIREGRLIAGQFASGARPALEVNDGQAVLRFDRAATPWLALSDWTIDAARDLPWAVFVSTSIGQIDADLSGLILQRGIFGSGFGGIRIVLPQEALEPLVVRSTLGSIRILTPPGVAARIQIRGPRIFGRHIDESRYQQQHDGAFVTLDAQPDSPMIEVVVSGTFGECYLG